MLTGGASVQVNENERLRETLHQTTPLATAEIKLIQHEEENTNNGTIFFLLSEWIDPNQHARTHQSVAMVSEHVNQQAARLNVTKLPHFPWQHPSTTIFIFSFQAMSRNNKRDLTLLCLSRLHYCGKKHSPPRQSLTTEASH